MSNENESKESIDLTEWKQEEMPSTARLAELIALAKGPERSMAELAAACNISPATLSRAINQKFTKPMSVELLQAIANNAADTSKVRLFDLLVANGMRKKGMHRSSIHMRMQRSRQRVRDAIDLVVRTLLEQGATIALRNDRSSLLEKSSTGYRMYWEAVIDTEFYQKCKQWKIAVFPYMRADTDETRMGNPRWHLQRHQESLARYFLCDIWEPDLLKKCKSTFIFFDEELYNSLCENLSHARVNNCITLMLIDEEAKKILQEYQLPGIKELPSVVLNKNKEDTSQESSFSVGDEISGDYDMEDNE